MCVLLRGGRRLANVELAHVMGVRLLAGLVRATSSAMRLCSAVPTFAMRRARCRSLHRHVYRKRRLALTVRIEVDVSTLPPIPAAAVSQSHSLTGRVGSRAREEADARQVGSGDEDWNGERLRAAYKQATTYCNFRRSRFPSRFPLHGFELLRVIWTIRFGACSR